MFDLDELRAAMGDAGLPRVDLLDPHLNLLDYSKTQLEGMMLAMFRCLRITAKFDIPTAQMVRPD